jgi:hypothetical protein
MATETRCGSYAPPARCSITSRARSRPAADRKTESHARHGAPLPAVRSPPPLPCRGSVPVPAPEDIRQVRDHAGAEPEPGGERCATSQWRANVERARSRARSPGRGRQGMEGRCSRRQRAPEARDPRARRGGPRASPSGARAQAAGRTEVGRDGHRADHLRGAARRLGGSRCGEASAA